jgi:phosphinothricin acetyltransferase
MWRAPVAEPFRIRDATEEDVAQIVAIYAYEVEHGVATFEEVAPSAEDIAGRFRNIKRLGLPYLAAERSGRLLGYAYAGQFHPRAAYRYTLEDTVYIHKDARRQGVARALLTELIARCEALGARQMMALITSVPDSASIALHARLGFRSMGVAPAVGYKFGRWLDVAYMQRPVGAANSTPPDRPVLGPAPTGTTDA